MLALVLAGGVIYGFPYLRQSYHGPMLETFGVTNTELGMLNSMFGLFALACYLPGGWLADRFSARSLLVVSLTGTGVGGLVFAALAAGGGPIAPLLEIWPPYVWLLVLHGFWGVSTILTFWAALIRATRSWAAPDQQGWAFGVLDGGRGLAEAVVAAVALVVFEAYAGSSAGLVGVIMVWALVCFVGAAAVYAFVREGTGPGPERSARAPRGAVKAALRLPSIWLLAGVILCAYSGYWGTFDFAKYAQDGYGASETFAAGLGTVRMWIRPVAAIAAGIAADRFRSSAIVLVGFLCMSAGYLAMALLPPGPEWVLWVEVGGVAMAVFALRGVYYALMEEGRIPIALTGIAVGLASVVGYTPDVFQPLVAGYLLDGMPGATGHQVYYAGLTVVGLIGAGCAFALARIRARETAEITARA